MVVLRRTNYTMMLKARTVSSAWISGDRRLEPEYGFAPFILLAWSLFIQFTNTLPGTRDTAVGMTGEGLPEEGQLISK